MSRFIDHRKAANILREIYNHKENYLIIHYSCESFFDTNGKSPRVTTIAVRYYASGQSKIFAIHQIAERNHVTPDEIVEKYDFLERELLTEFYDFVKNHNNSKWIHWNMRDSNFGFEAIDQRYQVLGGSPISIPDSNKINLSRLFIALYGKNYIDDPRIEKLIEKNKRKALNFLNGKTEAEAFRNRQYVELAMSSARKVEVFSNFIESATNHTLLTNSKRSEIYGNGIMGLHDYLSEKDGGRALLWLLNIIVGGIVGGLITKIFF